MNVASLRETGPDRERRTWVRDVERAMDGTAPGDNPGGCPHPLGQPLRGCPYRPQPGIIHIE